MWDERYSAENYAYGKQPNDFLKSNYQNIPKGAVLSLAEGEGRNAVFLAQMGYTVTAVDSSIIGIEKGMKLAEENEVQVTFIHADLKDFQLDENAWSGIVSIFCPLPSTLRSRLYKQLAPALVANGSFLLEAYTPAQIHFDTGGGKDIDTMQSKSTLIAELTDLKYEHLAELERDIIEGEYHTGTGSVVQAIARKY